MSFPRLRPGAFSPKTIHIMTQAKTSKIFDLDLDEQDKTAAEEPIRVAVAVDDEGNDVCGFFVAGKNSSAYQKESQRIRAAALRRAANRKSVSDTTTEAGSVSLAKTIDANEQSLAAAILVGWFGFGRANVAIEFNRDVAAGLLVKYPTWREKIIAAVEADANFTKA